MKCLRMLILMKVLINTISAIDDGKRLYDYLTRSYDALIIPIRNHSDAVVINIGLRYIRVDIDEKNQIMTSDVWFYQDWIDYRLKWNPKDFDNQEVFYLPIKDIWVPEIVLYNTADGKYEPSMTTKATIFYNGSVIWRSPTIFKSFCMVDIQYFPFDESLCHLKFSSWIHDGKHVKIKHQNSIHTRISINLTDSIRKSIQSNQWNVKGIGAVINSEFVNSNNESRPYIKFFIKLDRKSLFHMVNLVIPCVSLALLSVVVFYLSSESNEKITLSVSILMALTLFFLILLETMPPTSMSVPLLGKYLLFTLHMVTLSICATIYVLNVHHRNPRLHERMSNKLRYVFFNLVPKFVHVKRTSEYTIGRKFVKSVDHDTPNETTTQKIIESLTYITKSMEKEAKETKEREEWIYLSIILDRLFIYMFSTAFLVGTFGIFLINYSPESDEFNMDD